MDDSRLTARHSLDVVARRTGLTRQRIGQLGFQGDHRCSDADIERLLMLARLNRLGLDPQELRGHSDEDLATLIALREASAAEGTRTGSLATPSAPVLERALEALLAVDSSELRLVLEASLATVGRSQFLRTLLIPLAGELKRLEAEGALRPFHEHFAATCLTEVLPAEPATDDPPPNGTLLVATPTSESHELELVVASEVARVEGFRVRRLGTGIPTLRLAAVGRLEPHPLLLTLSRPSAPGVLTEELSYLVARWRGGPLLFHGRRAAFFAAEVERKLALRPPRNPYPAPIVVPAAAQLAEVLRAAESADEPVPAAAPVATYRS